ncbi:6-methylsalicylic acid decarboxylase atA [Lachnellula suecica]|uniref:6-methylsalicylic acid decarboxylase atA n=1 Tax=Lachnellula suecica TaxID=602035 RepID=A0A8T9CBB6_9HELO|nr:6-methylsalicylic acid decarboxylase atA [Lachnellula suecica]
MPSSTPTPPISIAIIGAGIAGITLAIALSKHNPSLKLTIYESRSEFSEIGAGVGFGPNAVQAMTLIDAGIAEAYDEVKTANLWPEKDHVWYDFHYGTGPKAGQSFGQISSSSHFTHSGGSRAAFLDRLVNLIPSTVQVFFNKKLTSISNALPHPLQITFSDNSSAHVDAVIACDGIRPVCRQILLGEDNEAAKAVYSGKYAYRKVVSMAAAVAVAGREVENRVVYSGHGGHILLFPISNGALLNIVVRSSKEAMLEDFEGWGEKCVGLLELINEPEKWALFDHPPASTYARGNLCLVGDAAHATTPHSGAGAGFAIEDVHLLSGLLTSEFVKEKGDLEGVFRAYDEVRRPRSQELVVRSRRNGMRLDFQNPDGEGELSVEQYMRGVEENMKWVWEIDLNAMLEEARALVVGYKEGK